MKKATIFVFMLFYLFVINVFSQDFEVPLREIENDMYLFNEGSKFRKVLEKLVNGEEFNNLLSTERHIYFLYSTTLPFVLNLIRNERFEELLPQAKKFIISDENCWLGYFLKAWAFIGGGTDSPNFDFSAALSSIRRADDLGYRNSDRFPRPPILGRDEMVNKLLSDARAHIRRGNMIEAENTLYRLGNIENVQLPEEEIYFLKGVVAYSLSDSLMAYEYFKYYEQNYPDANKDTIQYYLDKIKEGFPVEEVSEEYVIAKDINLLNLYASDNKLKVVIPGYSTMPINLTYFEGDVEPKTKYLKSGESIVVNGGRISQLDFNIKKFNKDIFKKLSIFIVIAGALLFFE